MSQYPFTVTIECAVSTADIYYTIDETDPTRESNFYDGEFQVSSPVTEIRAFAIHPAYSDSDITTHLLDLTAGGVARITLDYVEVFRKGFPSARLTTDYVEVLRKGLPSARLTNNYIEVLTETI